MRYLSEVRIHYLAFRTTTGPPWIQTGLQSDCVAAVGLMMMMMIDIVKVTASCCCRRRSLRPSMWLRRATLRPSVMLWLRRLICPTTCCHPVRYAPHRTSTQMDKNKILTFFFFSENSIFDFSVNLPPSVAPGSFYSLPLCI